MEEYFQSTLTRAILENSFGRRRAPWVATRHVRVLRGICQWSAWWRERCELFWREFKITFRTAGVEPWRCTEQRDDRWCRSCRRRLAQGKAEDLRTLVFILENTIRVLFCLLNRSNFWNLLKIFEIFLSIRISQNRTACFLRIFILPKKFVPEFAAFGIISDRPK